MTTADAFLEAIREEPDDDAVRLIYADWLEERGDPRGEFIWAQVEAARLERDDSRRAPLRARAWELLQANWEAWVEPLRRILRRGHPASGEPLLWTEGPLRYTL